MIANIQKPSNFRNLFISSVMFLLGTTMTMGQSSITAPTNLVVTPKNTSVEVTFTAGTASGTTIDVYEYTVNGGTTWTPVTGVAPAVGAATPTVTIANLTTGVNYTMNIRAMGTNTPTTGASSANFTFTTTTLTAPTGLVATAGWQELSIAFVAPSSNGGNGITNYEYSTDNGTTWVVRNPASTVTPLLITGLTNGTEYNVRLRAVNALGTGTVSAVVKGTPLAIATAPTIVSVDRFNDSLKVNFTAPTTPGTPAFTTYQYSVDNGTTWTTSGTATSTFIIVDNLVMNTTYQVKLRAVNTVGPGTASVATEVTTHNLTAPTALVATAGNGQLTIAFTAPSVSSFGNVTNYQYMVGEGAWVTAGVATSPLTVTNLANGVTHSIRLRAVNGGGFGAASVAVTGVPRNTATLSNVQFIHNNGAVGSVDIFAEGTKIFDNLETGKATTFLKVDGNELVDLVITTADNATTLGTLSETFTVDTHNVVVIQGGLNSKPFSLNLLKNMRNASSKTNSTQYVFFNGFSNLDKVTLQRVSTSTPRLPEGPNQGLVGVNVEYAAFTGYYNHDNPGITTLQVLTNNTVVGQFMFDLGSYDNRTFVLVGNGVNVGTNPNTINLVGYDVNGNAITSRVTTSNENDSVEIPNEFTLYGNYPNPFNPSTSIRFDLPENANVRIQVVDALGRSVMNIPAQNMTAGVNKNVMLDASRLSSGVYFYKLIAEGSNNTFVKSSKFTLLK